MRKESTTSMSTMERSSSSQSKNEVADSVLIHHEPCVCIPIDTMAVGGRAEPNNDKRQGIGIGMDGDPQYTLSSAHCHAVCYGISGFNSGGMLSDNPNVGIYEAETSRTLDLNGGSPACNQGGMMVLQEKNQAEDNAPISVHATQTPITAKELAPALSAQGYIGVKSTAAVRRLTPLECTRLQGFPDGWVDIGEWTDSKGRLHKDADAPKYKALGNSIALPFWKWMAKRMAKYLPEGSTMASLFDGLGGFPIAFGEAGVEPAWASEIEEFCIAVTKKHFPEEGEQK